MYPCDMLRHRQDLDAGTGIGPFNNWEHRDPMETAAVNFAL